MNSPGPPSTESAPPPLTVAVPTCNGARHLAETLRGILSQQGVSFDLLVCDDRSDDETRSVVESEAGPGARFEVNAERLGLAGNWNRCVALSRTPLVAVVHQDDVLLPGHLAAHVSAFGADPNLGLVASASVVIDAEGRPVDESRVGRGGLGASDRVFPPGAAVGSMAAGNPLRCSAVTLRGAAHAALGGFDPSYRYVVDWEFWLRVASSYPVAWLARPTVAVRWHAASETHTFKTGTLDLEETGRVLGTLDASGRLDPATARTANQRLARAYLNRAHVGLRAGDGRLARRCLLRGVKLSPGVLGAVAADPRLAAQMAAAFAAPGAAGRFFRRP